MKSLNERAWEIVSTSLHSAAELGMEVTKMESGTLLVDAGIHATGGMEAGLLMAEAGTAGLAKVSLELADLNNRPWSWAGLQTDHPLEACYLSQSAHWQVKLEGFQAMGSGPACLLNRELGAGKEFDFEEAAEQAVLVLETRQMPTDITCCKLAESCQIKPENLAILLAPTSSLAGSVQIAARSVETALHKLHTLGFDLRKVTAGMGRCPIAAPTGDDLLSLGRTNDLVMLACRVWLGVRGVQNTELERITAQLPASASPSYGLPFLQALKKAGGFYNLDAGLFAPAEVTLTNLDSGSVFHAGGIDRERLEALLKG